MKGLRAMEIALAIAIVAFFVTKAGASAGSSKCKQIEDRINSGAATVLDGMAPGSGGAASAAHDAGGFSVCDIGDYADQALDVVKGVARGAEQVASAVADEFRDAKNWVAGKLGFGEDRLTLFDYTRRLILAAKAGDDVAWVQRVRPFGGDMMRYGAIERGKGVLAALAKESRTPMHEVWWNGSESTPNHKLRAWTTNENSAVDNHMLRRQTEHEMRLAVTLFHEYKRDRHGAQGNSGAYFYKRGPLASFKAADAWWAQLAADPSLADDLAFEAEWRDRILAEYKAIRTTTAKVVVSPSKTIIRQGSGDRTPFVPVNPNAGIASKGKV